MGKYNDGKEGINNMLEGTISLGSALIIAVIMLMVFGIGIIVGYYLKGKVE